MTVFFCLNKNNEEPLPIVCKVENEQLLYTGEGSFFMKILEYITLPW